MANFDSTENQDWIINLDIGLVSEYLAKDPAFIEAVAKLVRNQMTNDVRNKGNLFGVTAQKQLNNQTKPPTLQVNTTRRVQ
jgi:hypothetical protein